MAKGEKGPMEDTEDTKRAHGRNGLQITNDQEVKSWKWLKVKEGEGKAETVERRLEKWKEGNKKLEVAKVPEISECELWIAEYGNWKTEYEMRRAENGERRADNGEWRAENGPRFTRIDTKYKWRITPEADRVKGRSKSEDAIL